MVDSKRSRYAQLGLGLGQLLGIPDSQTDAEKSRAKYIHESNMGSVVSEHLDSDLSLPGQFFRPFQPGP